MGSSALAIVFLILVIAAAVVAIILVVRSGSGGDAAPPESGTCGGCGYAVRGIESWRCPECGADLRRVGIEVPRRKSATPVWITVVCIALLTFVLVLGALFLVQGQQSAQFHPVIVPRQTSPQMQQSTRSSATQSTAASPHPKSAAPASQPNTQPSSP